jgi:hypothetical protein
MGKERNERSSGECRDSDLCITGWCNHAVSVNAARIPTSTIRVTERYAWGVGKGGVRDPQKQRQTTVRLDSWVHLGRRHHQHHPSILVVLLPPLACLKGQDRDGRDVRGRGQHNALLTQDGEQ